MIPSLNLSGVLPPYLSTTGLTHSAGMSPYKTSLVEIITHFTTTPERVQIFQNLLNYRRDLRAAGIVNGFQWIDGSYVEDCEGNRARAPKDVDIITFAERPAGYADNAIWVTFVAANLSLFDQTASTNPQCHANYVDLGLPVTTIVSHTRFWFGLLSHQRVTFLWKGILEVNLQADDADAQAILNGGNRNVA